MFHNVYLTIIGAGTSRKISPLLLSKVIGLVFFRGQCVDCPPFLKHNPLGTET